MRQRGYSNRRKFAVREGGGGKRLATYLTTYPDGANMIRRFFTGTDGAQTEEDLSVNGGAKKKANEELPQYEVSIAAGVGSSQAIRWDEKYEKLQAMLTYFHSRLQGVIQEEKVALTMEAQRKLKGPSQTNIHQ